MPFVEGFALPVSLPFAAAWPWVEVFSLLVPGGGCWPPLRVTLRFGGTAGGVGGGDEMALELADDESSPGAGGVVGREIGPTASSSGAGVVALSSSSGVGGGGVGGCGTGAGVSSRGGV